ncbi:MAG: STAS domain-containing protein [Myxococcales bacterium]|nr:STAS domain-containing protein [Myxococcales bacterium]
MADGPTIHTRASLQALDVLRAPIWVFDLDHALRWWINLAGVELWGAPSREHLIDRSRPMQHSEATTTRLAMYRRCFERGETITERWSIYPDGQPSLRIESTCSGIFIDDEDGAPPRLAMLVEARKLRDSEADPLDQRSVEALRHVGEPVSLYTTGGRVLLRNPAAMRAFGDAADGQGDELARTFVDAGAAARAREALDGAPRRFDASLRTTAGEQVHNLEVRATRDPVTGEPALLVCSRDLGERLAYERQLEHGRRQIAAQAEELARLAAPVLRVWPRLLVLPLIGRVDRGRMDVALAALTPRLTSDQAAVVIFDLTGAAFVDVETVESLQRALRTLALLGCEVALAGIQPALAALLVASAVELAAPIHQTIADALQDVVRADGAALRRR